MRRTSLAIGPFVLALVVVLAGCSFGKDDPVAVSSDGNSVVKDALDDYLDHNWSCSSLRLSWARVPHDLDLSQPVAMLHEATGKACNDALDDVEIGQSREQVVSLLGGADASASGCLLFEWPPAEDSSIDGARVCLVDGHVAALTTATHA